MLKNTSLYSILSVFLLFSCTNDQNLTDKSIDRIVLELQEKSRQSKIDSTLFYLKTADTLITTTPSITDSIIIENDFLKGTYYINTGKPDSASIYLYRTIERIKDTIKRDKELLYFYNAWDVHLSINEIGEAIAISKRFESLLDRKNYPYRAVAYYQLTNTYSKTREYDKALENADLQIDMLKKANDSSTLASAVINKSQIQYDYFPNKEIAIQTLEDLIEKDAPLNLNAKHDLYAHYGYFQHLQKNYSEAKKNYLQGVRFLELTNDSPLRSKNIAVSYANLGEVSLDLHEYDSAKYYLDKALTLNKDYIAESTLRNILSYKMRYAYDTKSNIKEVQKYLDTILKYQNARYEKKYTSQLKSLETSYLEKEAIRAQKQQVEIEKIRTQAQLLFVFVLSILLIGLGVYFYKKRQRSFDTMSLQMQQRLLRSQMNPHFTFNTLYAIQNTIKKDQQGAIDYLLKFSRLLRLILENSTNNYVQLEKEIESLRKYMDLQLLRFPSKFDYEIHLQDLEEDDFIFIPPMLMQPYIENSIEHGFQGIDYKGKISITLSEKNEFLECRIEDNGRGIDTTKNSYKKSISTTLIANFIEKATKQKITDINKKDLDSSTSGVITTFLIPYKQTEHD
ncbi:histidine kinase [Dokdonia sp.]|uniref:tetratricopeptide repeat-containing sensor histidine kinase n=1 Tax=Dokdonia sp. TaxID=2024995 RepID=UPI0032667E50